MPEQIDPEEVHTEEETQDTSVSVSSLALDTLQLTLDKLVRLVANLLLATLTLICVGWAILLVSL